MANRNFANSRIYTGHVMPIYIDCNFIVDSTNGNGLGIRSLKGPYVQNVFMHTAETAGAGNSNPQTPNMVITNPNPAAGTIIVQLQDNYNRSYFGGFNCVSPLGTSILVDVSDSLLTIGAAYVVTVVGNATAADWLALGVPAGLIAPVAPFVTTGTAFIALAEGSGTSSTSKVAPTAAAGSDIFTMETVGDPNQSLAPSIAAQGFGAQLILQARNDSSGDASQIHQPADGTVISLQFMLSNSSVMIAGE